MRCVCLDVAGQALKRLRLLAALALFSASCSTNAGSPNADLLAVSKPPASLVPTDPPQGLVYRASPDLGTADVFFAAKGGPIDLVYIVLDAEGNGYLTFDDGPDDSAPGGVMVVEDVQSREERTFDTTRDRLITGSRVGLVEPKDLILVESQGLLIVADFASATIRVFDALATGNVAPRFVTDKLGEGAGGEPRRPWGLAYDEVADRLFVGATDGTLLVYDAFLASRGENGPSRTVTPTWQGSAASHNLHELLYDRATDRIIVTDVGAATTSDQPGFDSDGALLVLERASRAQGPTPVGLRLAGPNSLLGNPVSLVQKEESIFVAENGLDLLLRFDGLLGRRGGVDVPPDAVISMVKPESLILLPQ